MCVAFKFPSFLSSLVLADFNRVFSFLTVSNPTKPQFKMQNDHGECVDLYIPRKCSASNRIIHAKDHASIQMSFVDVDEAGVYKNSQTAYAICGALRRMGESDDCINRLAKRSGLLPKNF